MSEQPSLADRFEALAKAATPGPWTCPITQNRFVSRDRIEDGLRVVTGVAETQWQDDADFIAFCGTERDRILEALRIAEPPRCNKCGKPAFSPTYHDDCEES